MNWWIIWKIAVTIAVLGFIGSVFVSQPKYIKACATIVSVSLMIGVIAMIWTFPVGR